MTRTNHTLKIKTKEYWIAIDKNGKVIERQNFTKKEPIFFSSKRAAKSKGIPNRAILFWLTEVK